MEERQQSQSDEKKIISLDKMNRKIHERANEIFLERGDKPGDALLDWLQAEKEIKEKFEII